MFGQQLAGKGEKPSKAIAGTIAVLVGGGALFGVGYAKGHSDTNAKVRQAQQAIQIDSYNLAQDPLLNHRAVDQLQLMPDTNPASFEFSSHNGDGKPTHCTGTYELKDGIATILKVQRAGQCAVDAASK